MKKGFTLIELLVVIGIIGLLVSIAVPNFLSARQRASDSKKKSEMQQLKNALRMYYNDYNRYPSGVAGGVNGAGNGLNMYGCGAAGIEICNRVTVCTSVDFAAGGTGCENIYMKRFPTGFIISPVTIRYYQMSSGDDFCLQTALSNNSDPDIASSQLRCGSVCGTTYCPAGRYCVCAD